MSRIPNNKAKVPANQKKQEPRNEPKSKKGSDYSNPEFETLKLVNGICTNFVLFRKSASDYLRSELGEVATLLITNEEFIPQDIDLPEVPWNDESDPHGIERRKLLKKVELREVKLAELDEAKVKLFAMLWRNLSEDSRDRVSRATVPNPAVADDEDATEVINDWEDVLTASDPVRLWQRILQTHRGTDTGVSALDRREAQLAYERVRQGISETLLSYKERFDNALQTVQEYEDAAEETSQQAIRFIENLDSARYTGFRVRIKNNAKDGIKPLPATWQDAYVSASTYVEESRFNPRARQGAAFHTREDGDEKGKRYGKDKGKKDGKKDPKKAAAADNSDPDSSCNIACPFCKAPPPTHWQRNCPHLKKAQADFEAANAKKKDGKAHVCFSRVLLSNSGDIIRETQVGDTMPLGPEESNPKCFTVGSVALKAEATIGVSSCGVLLDNQATVSIFFNRDLLTDIREADSPCHISGINSDGSALVANLIGDFREFGPVYYCPAASANILSFSVTAETCENNYNRDRDEFTSQPPYGNMYRFTLREGLYVCHVDRHESVLNTVTENKQEFSQREIKDADRALEFIRSLAHPSVQSAIELLKSGAVINCPVTIQDVYRAGKIYGKDLAAVRGKTHRHKPEPIKVDFLPREVSSNVVLHTDIMFVDGDAFLLTVGTPLGLTMVNELGRTKGARALGNIREKLMSQVKEYKSRRFDVVAINTDGEGSIHALKPELGALGIEMNPVGAGSHVGPIERKIEEVKERCRGIKATLSFRLALQLIAWLVFFCVSRINLVPHKSGLTNISPAEAFLGRKIDYRLDLRCGFGDYVECYNPLSDNSMRPRTEAAITLMPTGNRTGSVQCLSLNTGRVIRRDQFTKLPMPDNVIAHLNKLADVSYLNGRRTDAQLDFSMGFNHDAILGSTQDEGISVEEAWAAANPLISIEERERPVDDLELTGGEIAVEHLADQVFENTEPNIPGAPSIHGEPNTLGEPSTTPEPRIMPDAEAEDPNIFLPEAAGPEDLAQEVDTSEPEPESKPIIPPRYNTRSSARCGESGRKRWDNKVLTNRVFFDLDTQLPRVPGDPPLDQARQAIIADRIKALTSAKERAKKHHQVFNIKVKEALKKMPKETMNSLFKEITQMVDKKVWKGVIPSQVKSFKQQKKIVIKSFMFLKEKFLSNGEFEKLKARLVAGGHMMDRSLIPEDLMSSPTASLPFIFLVAAIAANEKRFVKTADITGAYLNADISERNILMELDETASSILLQIDPSYRQFLQPNNTIVVELQKALYGCVESSKLWYDLITATLEAAGYSKNPIDPCVLNKTQDGVQCTVVIYVDDLMVTSVNPRMIDEVMQVLTSRFEGIEVHDGPVFSYLGLTWDFSVPGEVKVTADGYTEELLKWAEVTGTAQSPAANHLFDIRDTDKLAPDKAEWFHSAVAKLLYLSKRTRPDILLPVSFLTTRVLEPNTDDWGKLQRVFRYLNSTPELGVILRPDHSGKTLEAFIDASYGVHEDGKSHTGMMISLGAGPFLVKSSKQKIVTKSSTEAELVALSDMCSPVIWSREFLIAQGVEPPAATVYQDNMSTIALADRGGSNSDRTRHIKIRRFWMKDRVADGEINIVYKPTEDMIADILTKPLQGAKFIELRRLLLNWSY